MEIFVVHEQQNDDQPKVLRAFKEERSAAEFCQRYAENHNIWWGKDVEIITTPDPSGESCGFWFIRYELDGITQVKSLYISRTELAG